VAGRRPGWLDSDPESSAAAGAHPSFICYAVLPTQPTELIQHPTLPILTAELLITFGLHGGVLFQFILVLWRLLWCWIGIFNVIAHIMACATFTA